MGTMSLANWHFRCYVGNGRRHSRIVKGRIFAVILALISIATLRAFAGDVVEIRLRGHYFSEPATVQITVAVEPDAANRVLRVEADGDRLYRSTELTLQGEGDKRLHTVEFKNLPAGAYELRAEVLSTDHVRGMATQELLVAGVGGR
jgi:hypothetical protein